MIFDEPTANLSVMATERLLETMAELKRQGVAQIIISHRLTDIFKVGDRVMVLKRGENVGDRYVAHTSEHEVLQLIVSGRPETADGGRGLARCCLGTPFRRSLRAGPAMISTREPAVLDVRVNSRGLSMLPLLQDQRRSHPFARVLAAFALACLSFASPPARAQSPTAAGVWKQIDDKTGKVRSLITIADSGGAFGGVITKVFPREGEKPMPLCEKCTGALANAPIIGLPLLSGLKRDGLAYEGGKIVDPESGTLYSVKMELSPDGQSLAVRGFVGVALLGRTQTWQREK